VEKEEASSISLLQAFTSMVASSPKVKMEMLEQHHQEVQVLEAAVLAEEVEVVFYSKPI
jgi:hypothetical protein